MPPIAEMGQLATILVSGRDRFVSVGQLVALAASVVAIAQVGHRLGSDRRTALFGALLFATLPVVILQGTSALNDLVVCSFLLCATAFLLSTSWSALAVGSLATALAVGTKVTAVLGLVWVLIAVVGATRRGPLVRVAGTCRRHRTRQRVVLAESLAHRPPRRRYGAESGQRPDGTACGDHDAPARARPRRSGGEREDVAVYWSVRSCYSRVAVAQFAQTRGVVLGAALVVIVPPLLAPLEPSPQGVQDLLALSRTELRTNCPPNSSPGCRDALAPYGPVLAVCFCSAARPPRPTSRVALIAPAPGVLGGPDRLDRRPREPPHLRSLSRRFMMFAVAIAQSPGWIRRWPRMRGGPAPLIVSARWRSHVDAKTGAVLFEHEPGSSVENRSARQTSIDQQSSFDRRRLDRCHPLRRGHRARERDDRARLSSERLHLSVLRSQPAPSGHTRPERTVRDHLARRRMALDSRLIIGRSLVRVQAGPSDPRVHAETV